MGNTATTYTDTGTDLDTRYGYHVKAKNAHGLSDVSNFARIDTWLDFTHFKRHKRGNLQYDGTEWRGVSVHRSWRSIVKNPPTPTTSGYAQR